jgi:hypothetical protein
MTRQQVIDKQIEEIMDEFDFQKVHKMFEQNGWTYGLNEVPSVGELRRTARGLLRDVSKNARQGFNYTFCARFFVYVIEDVSEKWLRMSLMFAPEEWGIDTADDYE